MMMALSTFLHDRWRREMSFPDQVIDCRGFRAASFTLFEAMPVEASDEVRICIPLGREPVVVSTVGKEVSQARLGGDDVAVVPPLRMFGLSALAPTPVALLWIDAEYLRHQARAAGSERLEVAEEFVAPDVYLRQIGSVVKAGMRDPAACTEYLARLSGELALHVVTAYGSASRRAVSRGLSGARLTRALQLIEERLCSSLLVNEIASAVNMSPFHFSRSFKRSTGQAPHFYITMRRMELAKEALTRTNTPLSEVAESVGYTTQAHFTGVFRTHVGTTPKAYRMRSRGLAAKA